MSAYSCLFIYHIFSFIIGYDHFEYLHKFNDLYYPIYHIFLVQYYRNKMFIHQNLDTPNTFILIRNFILLTIRDLKKIAR